MQAYIWQCGNRWCIQIQTPSGAWVTLAHDYATDLQARHELLSYEYEEITR